MKSTSKDHALLADMKENRGPLYYITWRAMTNYIPSAEGTQMIDGSFIPRDLAREEIKFGFPNECTLPSGAFYARWPNQMEIAISPKHDFFVWRPDIAYGTGKFVMGSITRINCDGLIHALALIHHVRQELGFEETPNLER
jgi:hypothetical protein